MKAEPVQTAWATRQLLQAMSREPRHRVSQRGLELGTPTDYQSFNDDLAIIGGSSEI